MRNTSYFSERFHVFPSQRHQMGLRPGGHQLQRIEPVSVLRARPVRHQLPSLGQRAMDLREPRRSRRQQEGGRERGAAGEGHVRPQLRHLHAGPRIRPPRRDHLRLVRGRRSGRSRAIYFQYFLVESALILSKYRGSIRARLARERSKNWKQRWRLRREDITACLLASEEFVSSALNCHKNTRKCNR